MSQQKHWCKYCKKFVANNKPSISLHESGQAHKDKVESFLRGVYRKGREDKEQAEHVRREIQRIEQAAMATAGAKDGARLMSGGSSSSSSVLNKSSSGSTNRPSRTGGVSGIYGCGANYYVPSIHELRNPKKEEAVQMGGREEWAIGKEIAKVGNWEVVTPTEPLASTPNKVKKKDQQIGTTHDQAPEFQDDDEDKEDLHQFKIKEKEYPDDIQQEEAPQENVVFKKRKLADSDGIKSKKKKPLRKKE